MIESLVPTVREVFLLCLLLVIILLLFYSILRVRKANRELRQERDKQNRQSLR